MRGKVILYYQIRSALGITPAYAGKSRRGTKPDRSDRDHPRLCGEKNIVHAVSKCDVGSPPPMRGKELR